ncbi:hypothetical protein HJG60_011976 [Phyllostomus discolor]|uniref:Uncharacterized protein n=1 Tax=Phyllostomus discolor TaxID=89673 RepID=A0A833ZP60_9CHIR|nr:hypothetical protein HJG60_011976 [Phyllostomus discolor]
MSEFPAGCCQRQSRPATLSSWWEAKGAPTGRRARSLGLPLTLREQPRAPVRIVTTCGGPRPSWRRQLALSRGEAGLGADWGSQTACCLLLCLCAVHRWCVGGRLLLVSPCVGLSHTLRNAPPCPQVPMALTSFSSPTLQRPYPPSSLQLWLPLSHCACKLTLPPPPQHAGHCGVFWSQPTAAAKHPLTVPKVSFLQGPGSIPFPHSHILSGSWPHCSLDLPLPAQLWPPGLICDLLDTAWVL